MKITDETLKCYLEETRFLLAKIRNNPKGYADTLKYFSMTKDNSKILGFTSVYNLCKAVEDIYKSLCDGKIVFTENLELLLKIVCEEIAECCNLIEENSPLYNEVDVRPYLLYCDKAVAGEIFDPTHITRNAENGDIQQVKKGLVTHKKREQKAKDKTTY